MFGYPMKRFLKTLPIVIPLFVGMPTSAQTPVDALSTCLVDHLNGTERKNLAKWVFFAMGAHPEIRSYSHISPSDINVSDKYMGRLVTRLLTEDCSDSFKAAYASDPKSIEKAFEIVGRFAMQELMSSENVQKAIGSYVKFTDVEKIKKTLGQ